MNKVNLSIYPESASIPRSSHAIVVATQTIDQIGEMTGFQPRIDHIIKIGELRVGYCISVSGDSEGSVFITALRQGHIEAD